MQRSRVLCQRGAACSALGLERMAYEESDVERILAFRRLQIALQDFLNARQVVIKGGAIHIRRRRCCRLVASGLYIRRECRNQLSVVTLVVGDEWPEFTIGV